MRKNSRKLRLGARISASRHLRGLSQGTVSRRSGIDPSYLSRIESGKVHPTVRTALKIAEALKMPLGDLVGPSPAERAGQPCPISASGRCLVELISPRPAPVPGRFSEVYSARQIRLLRQFAGLLQRGGPGVLEALEVLVARMTSSDAGRAG